MLESENGLDIEEMRKGFEMFDVDGTGYISPSELLEIFDAMNLKSKNPFIYNIILSITKSKKYSSKISLDELIKYIDSKLNDNTKKGINLIFDSLCEPNNDHLSISSLPQFARDTDDIITEKELRNLIQKAEMGGEDIDFNEFLKILGDGKNLEENDSDENDILSDKENIDNNIKKNNGGNMKEIKEKKELKEIKEKKEINDIKEKKEENNLNNKNKVLESKYSFNSNNSNNSNNNSLNKVYRKKASNRAIQNNNENINKNISNKALRNDNNSYNKKKVDDKIININISEEIKKSEKNL